MGLARKSLTIGLVAALALAGGGASLLAQGSSTGAKSGGGANSGTGGGPVDAASFEVSGVEVDVRGNNAEAARQAVKHILEADPPYGAQVAFDAPRGENGWNAPTLAPWLAAALDKASNAAFGKPTAFQGEGGSIPFMGMLGRRYPETQFVITGVLGPHSNAHGPNEFLDIGYAKKLSAAVASILADHARR